MEKMMFHQIVDDTYIGMINILDYEISVKKCLADCGMNQYRFVAFDVSDEGRILWNSNNLVFG